MTGRLIAFMIHASLLQIIVLVLRVATSYEALGQGLSVLEIGLISSSYALLPILLTLPIGRLMDLWGERPALIAGSLLLLLAVFMFNAFGGTPLGLTLCTSLLGLAHFLSMVGQHSFIVTLVDPARRDAQFGWYAAAIALGQVLGPLLIAFPANGAHPDTAWVFMVCIGLCAGHLFMLMLAVGFSRPAARARTGAPSSIRTLLRIPGLRMAIVTGIAVMAAIDLLTIYLPVLGTERGISAAIVASLLSVRALATLLSRVGYGFMAARLTRGAFLGLTIGGAALGLCLFVFPVPVPVLFIAAVVLGVGVGAAFPLTLSWITDIAPDGERGTVLSLRQSALRMAQLVIPAAGGAIAVVTGVGGVFLVLACFLGGVAATAARPPRPATG